jgi:hypothetical protein
MATKPEKRFDSAKLQSMIEPLSVRIERIKGNVKQPITLPIREDGATPGTNLTRDDILRLEDFLLNQWSGGGFYEAEVVDAQGTKMSWLFGWSPALYPERIPPTAEGAAVMQAPQGTPLPPFGGGSSGWSTQQPQQQGYPQQVYPQQFAPQGWGPPQPHPQQHHDNDRIRALEEQLRRSELAQKEAEFRATTERQQQQHAADMAAMREEMRRFAEAQSSKRPSEDDAIRQMKDEMARERERHERERADDRHRQEMAAIQTQFAQMQQQFLAAQQNKGPDPMLEYMRENSRQQSETAKEIARAQQASADKMASYMLRPTELASLIKEQSSGTDQFIHSMMNSMTGAMDLYKRAAEQAVQMSGGGPASPAAEIIQNGVEGAKEVLKQWVSARRDQAVSESRSRAVQAQAQAQVLTAQAQAHGVAQGAAHQAQLAGPQQQPAGIPPGAKPVGWAPPPVAQQTNGNVTTGKIPVRSPSEEQMLGPAYESVQRLRKGVAEGILDAEKAANAILQGIAHAENAQVQIPAFLLFAEGQYADFMDVLLPKAPQKFRDDCVALITRAAEGDGGDEGDEDGMAYHDDPEDSDSDESGVQAS